MQSEVKGLDTGRFIRVKITAPHHLQALVVDIPGMSLLSTALSRRASDGSGAGRRRCDRGGRSRRGGDVRCRDGGARRRGRNSRRRGGGDSSGSRGSN